MAQGILGKDKGVIEEVTRWAQARGYDANHATAVSRTALLLFDALQALHTLGPGERLFLEAASLLHDIGLQKGGAKHHKIARDIIITAKDLPFSRDELVIVGLLARYHRKSMPKKTHKYFGDLSAQMQLVVNTLASFLRIADGLDRSHQGLVVDVACFIRSTYVELRVNAQVESREDCQAALLKADLFEKLFRKKIKIEWTLR